LLRELNPVSDHVDFFEKSALYQLVMEDVFVVYMQRYQMKPSSLELIPQAAEKIALFCNTSSDAYLLPPC